MSSPPDRRVVIGYVPAPDLPDGVIERGVGPCGCVVEIVDADRDDRPVDLEVTACTDEHGETWRHVAERFWEETRDESAMQRAIRLFAEETP